jgi:hypothetical protein
VTGATASVLALLVGRNLVEAADGELAVHQVVHDVMAGATPAEAVERHTGYYLDLVNEDRQDWRRIEAVYEQVRFAWQQPGRSRCEEPSPQLFQFVVATCGFTRNAAASGRINWRGASGLNLAQAEDMTSEAGVHAGQPAWSTLPLGRRPRRSSITHKRCR